MQGIPREGRTNNCRKQKMNKSIKALANRRVLRSSLARRGEKDPDLIEHVINIPSC